MSKSLTAFVVCLGLNSLSCGLTAARISPTPAVSAPPTVAMAEVAEPTPAAAAVAPTPTPAALEELTEIDSLIPAIADYLRAYHTGLADHEIDAVARAIVVEARRYDFDPSLVLAVMHVESGYYNFATSPVGALGLMQLLPSTAEYMAQKLGIEWKGSVTLFQPVTNVRLGVAYLDRLSRRYHSLPVALAAYNWGPSRIDRRLRRGASLPTRYAQLVLDAYGERISEINRRS